MVKNPPANAGDLRDMGLIPRLGRYPGGSLTTHSSILAWKIPWTEKPYQLSHLLSSPSLPALNLNVREEERKLFSFAGLFLVCFHNRYCQRIVINALFVKTCSPENAQFGKIFCCICSQTIAPLFCSAKLQWLLWVLMRQHWQERGWKVGSFGTATERMDFHFHGIWYHLTL